MQIYNPLVPPPVGSPGGAPAVVANAPAVFDSPRPDTARPVTASKDAERGRSDGERPRAAGTGSKHRGSRIDISV